MLLSDASEPVKYRYIYICVHEEKDAKHQE